MKPTGRPAGDKQPESIDFVLKRELDQGEQQIHRQQREIELLRQEVERLRKELEAALRASKRQAAPFARCTKTQPETPRPQTGPALRPAGVPSHSRAGG
jgi:hypothetical protein